MLEDARESIINVHYMMLIIAAKHKHVYARWKNILAYMTEKDLGSTKIH